MSTDLTDLLYERAQLHLALVHGIDMIPDERKRIEKRAADIADEEIPLRRALRHGGVRVIRDEDKGDHWHLSEMVVRAWKVRAREGLSVPAALLAGTAPPSIPDLWRITNETLEAHA